MPKSLKCTSMVVPELPAMRGRDCSYLTGDYSDGWASPASAPLPELMFLQHPLRDGRWEIHLPSRRMVHRLEHGLA